MTVKHTVEHLAGDKKATTARVHEEEVGLEGGVWEEAEDEGMEMSLLPLS